LAGGNRPRVLVIGDVINDILVETQGPLQEGADNPARIRSRPGGSAANQAAWMGHLGLDVVFAGRAGQADAELHQAELARFGVDARLAADQSAGTGSVVVLVGADGERTMITDRGANLRLAASDVPFGLLDDVALLHLTGHVLFEPGPRSVARDLIAQARRRGVPFTVDPGSTAFLARLPPAAFLEWTRGAAICFPNRDEAEVLSGATQPAEMAAILARHYDVVAMKLGPEGALVMRPGGTAEHIAVRPAVVRDTTGAGDAFCAGFLAAWLRGDGLAGGAHAATRAAAAAVSSLGGRPQALTGAIASPDL